MLLTTGSKAVPPNGEARGAAAIWLVAAANSTGNPHSQPTSAGRKSSNRQPDLCVRVRVLVRVRACVSLQHCRQLCGATHTGVSCVSCVCGCGAGVCAGLWRVRKWSPRKDLVPEFLCSIQGAKGMVADVAMRSNGGERPAGVVLFYRSCRPHCVNPCHSACVAPTWLHIVLNPCHDWPPLCSTKHSQPAIW